MKLVKLIVEKDGKILCSPEKGLPTAEAGPDRFSAAERLAENLGARDPRPQDLVRLKIEDEDTKELFIMHVDGEEVEGEFWRPQSLFDLDLGILDSYSVIPAFYVEDYLEEGHNYGEGDQVDVVKTVIEGEEGFLALKKSFLRKVSTKEAFLRYGEMSGSWELPGGRIANEMKEGRFEAARREIREEAGIELENGEDLLRIEVEASNLVNCYLVYYRDWGGELELSEEHTDHRWVSADEYIEMDWHRDSGYSIPALKFLQDYREKEVQFE